MKTKETHFSPKASSRWQFLAMAAMLSLAALGLSACGGGGGGSDAGDSSTAVSGGDNGGGAVDAPGVAAVSQVFSSGGLLWGTDGTEAGTVPFIDFSARETSPDGNGYIVFNGHTYFTTDTEMGTEIWKTDGTKAGTVMVKNVSFLCSRFRLLNGGLYFIAGDDTHGCELWKTDGTTAGTVMLKDINPAGDRLNFFGGVYVRLDDAKVVNGAIYFMADDGSHGEELWKTDGTTAGTVMVKDMNPGSEGTNLYLDESKQFNGALYFVAGAGAGGFGLWKTDGATVDKVLVFFSDSEKFIVLNSEILMPYNGALYFLGESSDGRSGLWKTDGTEAGTVFVKGSFGSVQGHTLFNDALYFVANDRIHGEELWKTDGTTAGTVLVKDINPGGGGDSGELPYDSGIDLSTSKVFNGALYFAANDDSHGYELWKTDGTEAGTMLVKDIVPGSEDAINSSRDSFEFKLLNGALYFKASISGDINFKELWKTDGTEAGTVYLKEIGNHSGPLDDVIVLIKDVPYFFGESPGGSFALWKVDGTEAGAVLVKDVDSATSDIEGGVFLLLKDGLYFQTISNGAEVALWKTDGTAAGTVLVKTFD